VGDHELLEVAQQDRVGLVEGVPLAGERDVVEREPGVARDAAVEVQPRLGPEVLGDRQRDPLQGDGRQRAVTKLGAEAPRPPRMCGCGPAPARAPLRIGCDASGAERSSWTVKRLMRVFMAGVLMRGG
jgi:hypothetical protein